MAEMAYVCLYFSYLDTLSPFSDSEKGRLVAAMINYAANGELPTFEGNERFIWPTIQSQIERDIEAYEKKCEKNRSNGAKGGRPKNPTVIEETQKTERFLEKPKKAKEKKKENEKEKKKENENNNINISKKPPKIKHGEFNNVALTEAEFEKLINDYGSELTYKAIKFLDEYIEEKNYKSRSHNLAIRRWVIDAVKQQTEKQQAIRKSNNASSNVFLEIAKEENLF